MMAAFTLSCRHTAVMACRVFSKTYECDFCGVRETIQWRYYDRPLCFKLWVDPVGFKPKQFQRRQRLKFIVSRRTSRLATSFPGYELWLWMLEAFNNKHGCWLPFSKNAKFQLITNFVFVSCGYGHWTSWRYLSQTYLWLGRLFF